MKTKELLLCGLFGALTAIFSQIMIPIGAVPVSLATLSVMLSSALLGARGGAFSQSIYVLVGAIGLPVFHGMQGGIVVLMGPTGGFLLGYPLFAWVGGRLTEKEYPFALSMGLGTVICYGLGSVWFWMLTKGTVWSVLLSCVIPFLPGDGLKIFIAWWLYKRLKGNLPIEKKKENS